MKNAGRLFIAAVPVFLLSASVVYAFKTPNAAHAASTQPSTIMPTMGAGMGHKLSGGSMHACLAREKGIQNRSTNLVTRATNMEAVFATIASRVEDYYTSKVVPSGKSVANYTTLTTAIQTQKDTVQTDLGKAQADATSFNCSSSDPKAEMTTYRSDMQTVIKDLQAYKQSVKNLIVAVRSLNGTQQSSGNTTNNETPSPSITTVPSTTPSNLSNEQAQ